MSHALIVNPLPLVPLPPSAPPMLLPQLRAQLPPELATQQVPDLQTLLAHAEPGTHKLVLDLYMRQNFPVLWRSAVENTRQTKAKSNRPAPANEPRMASKERIDHELPFGPDENLKRSASGTQDDSRWQAMFTETSTNIFQDPASIQTFYNELNHYACSGSSCSSGSSVHLDYTGPRPNDAIEPFNYPILVDRDLRSLEPEGFHATANRLHAVSIPAPFPFMNDRPPRKREAVNVMAIGSECEHITPYQPASCTSFSGGDQIAQIDKFFNENRAQGKVPGVVFVEGAVIEKWARESSMKGTTALAIRPEKTHLWVLSGLGGFALLSGLVAGLCCCRKKLQQCPGATARFLQAGWAQCRNTVSDWWNRCRPVPAPAPAVEVAHADEGADHSIVVDSSDETDSAHRGDFSSSSMTSQSSDNSEDSKVT